MLVAVLLAQLAAAGPADKVDVLALWMEAVEQHQPGTLDAAAERVQRLSRPQLERLRIDLRSVMVLMHNPKASVFYPDQIERRARVMPILYTQQELDVLRDLAHGAARRGHANRLLKRAAVLHTDIEIRAPRSAQVQPAGPETLLQRTTVFVDDGRLVALVDAIDHSEMSRRLLDEVRPRPTSDPAPQADADVRLWYTALSAYFHGIRRIGLAHFEDAVRVFPDDADLLFFAGAIREMASAPGVHATLKRASGPRGSILNLGSVADEMRLAERLYRRALAAAPEHIEARLRLGRVLSRLGRYADAAQHLRRVTTTLVDSPLPYYGYLFLGDALEAQRDLAGARAAYEQAAALAPSAQAPQLALSHLNARAGDHALALGQLQRVLSTAEREQPDPLWSYHVSAGRHANALLTRMYAALAPEEAR